MSSSVSPSIRAAEAASLIDTTEEFGTVSTSSRRATSTLTSAFIPGRSSPSSLSSRMSTGNIVTFWSTTDCGSILWTVPRNERPGNASTVTVVCCPREICPMSVSSTLVRTCITVRSAILNSVVPPDTFDIADAMICPTSAWRSISVPVMGARMVTSLLRSLASCRFVSLRTRVARAVADASTAASTSCSVTTPDSRSWLSLLRWDSAVEKRTLAASRSAAACW